MKHAMRKYLSSSGSALFMVVGTMSALIMLVTAMYLSVLSSRSVQLTVFNQDQAYVSSTAISDIIQAYMSGSTSNTLTSKLLEDDFESISTNGNGFAELTGNNTDAASTVFGAYDITITRLNDEGAYRIFDIAVTVANNGIYETTHSLMSVDVSKTEPADMNETFAATGYIPNDVWIDSGTYNGSLYFDSEYTRFGDVFNSGGGLSIKCEVRCAGSLVCDMATSSPVELKEPSTWVIGNNMFIGYQPRLFDLGGNTTENGKMYIGGDLHIKSRGAGVQFGGGALKRTDVYVVGDCYITDIDHFYGDLYVGGDVYFVGRYSNGNNDDNCKIYITSESNIYVDDGNGNYYTASDNHPVSGQAALCWNHDYGSVKDATDMDGDGDTGEYVVGPDQLNAFKATLGSWNKQDAIDYLNTALMQAPFYIWDVDDTNAKTNVIDQIKFDNGYTATANYIYEIDEDCTVNDIIVSGNQVSSVTILIDTGDDPEGKRTIVLGSNNTDSDGDDKLDCFTWAPSVVNWDGTISRGIASKMPVNIVTIGCGNLIIDVPSNVNYQASNQEFFGHYSWFRELGGTIGTHSVSGKKYFDRGGLNLVGAAAKVLPYIHHTCKTDCTYAAVDSDTDGKTDYYKCMTHGGQFEPLAVEAEGRTECLCNNKLHDAPKYDYGSYTGEKNKANVNIFLVSSTESASIKFCHSKVMNNVYFGFVYAPYMTYMDEGGGGGLKSVGGLIVSDYIMRGAYEYIQCYPDLPLSKVMGKDYVGDGGGTTNKTWRVYGV